MDDLRHPTIKDIRRNFLTINRVGPADSDTGIPLARRATGQHVECAAAAAFCVHRVEPKISLFQRGQVGHKLLQAVALELVGVIAAKVRVFRELLAAQLVVTVLKVGLNGVLIELVHEHGRELRVLEPHRQASAPGEEVHHRVEVRSAPLGATLAPAQFLVQILRNLL